MPIRMTIDGPNRMVMGVATGMLSVPELVQFLQEFLAADKAPYRKIIDFSGLEGGFDENGLAEFVKAHQGAKFGANLGPLALVVNDRQKALAYLFTQITGDARPANIFRSIHDARAWVATHSAREAQPQKPRS